MSIMARRMVGAVSVLSLVAYSKPKGYTGTGASNAITGVNFAPDFVWIKDYLTNATDHYIFDSTRGTTKYIVPDTTAASTTDANTLTAFGTDGFTVGTSALVNNNTKSYISYNFKKAIGFFDIVSYTGNGANRTISHALGVTPKLIIVKRVGGAASNWAVYHANSAASPQNNYISLNTTAANAADATVWNNTAPTTSVFSVGTSTLVNNNTDTYIAYLFSNVAGKSAFGSYTGNGSATGPTVSPGFAPSIVLIKNVSNVSDWVLFDTVRGSNIALSPNNNANHFSLNFSFLSSGFQITGTDSKYNTNGDTYVYAAFK